MTPEEYARHRERVLYLSDHPLVEDRSDGPTDADETRQATLSELEVIA